MQLLISQQHCFAGISRSSTVCIAYLMNSKKIKKDEALSLIRVNRPQANPNQGFVTQLQAYQKIILGE